MKKYETRQKTQKVPKEQIRRIEAVRIINPEKLFRDLERGGPGVEPIYVIMSKDAVLEVLSQDTFKKHYKPVKLKKKRAAPKIEQKFVEEAPAAPADQ